MFRSRRIAVGCLFILVLAACRGAEPDLSRVGLVLPAGNDAGIAQVQSTMVDAGDGGTTVMPPVDVPCPAPSTTELDDVVRLSATDDFACAVRRGGSVVCWGRNDQQYAVMGAANPVAVARPVTIANLASVRSVGTGNGHACALEASGALKCWGSNFVGEAGQGTVGGTVFPPRPTNLSGVTAVGVGSDHVCAATADKVFCWGSPSYGRTAQDSNSGASGTPAEVMGLTGSPSALTAGAEATCAAMKQATGTTVHCWGSNYNGLLGTGSSSDLDFKAPQAVTALSNRFADVTLSNSGFGCARSDSLPVSCWGHNVSGAIGDVLPGSAVRTPVQASPSVLDANVKRVASMGYGTCAITGDGNVACLGANGAAQLGSGASDSAGHGTPTLALAARDGDAKLAKAFDVAVGGTSANNGFVCAAVGDRPACGGKVMCWGSNQYGQLGNAASVDGSNVSAMEPFPVRVALPLP